MEKSVVNPNYRKQLDQLAETLMADRREKLVQEAGQLVLFEVTKNDAN